MVHSEKEGFVDDGKAEGSDNINQVSEEVSEGSSVGVSSRDVETSYMDSTGPSSVAQEGRSSGSDGGFMDRLRGIFSDEGDGYLSLQRNSQENSVLQWLQALDLQVLGACRADERLKPLLKLNISSGVAEDRLLAQLSKHFEAPEVVMLARCLFIPLVSIRVGKVVKQGTLLCPTSTRGNLNLTLLPTSDMRISFVGDDGCVEKVATLSSNSGSSAIVIEEIPADTSGRSFLIKLLGGQVLYFWCSEKSKLLGVELLAKMKDLLRRKPSLAQLTGISESRLDCFATHLRAYLLGSTASNTQAKATVLSTSSMDTACDPSELDQNTQLSSASSRLSRSRYNTSQVAKPHSLHQGSLSPRPTSFKDGLPRNLSFTKNGAREKFRRWGDGYLSSADSLPLASTSAAQVPSTGQTENDKRSEVSGPHHLLPLSFLESLGKSVAPPTLSPSSFCNPSSQVSAIGGSTFSPYYCWCPPFVSTLQCTVTPPQLPISLGDSVSLPPLSSLSSGMRSSSSLVLPKASLNLADVPSLDFPAFLPDPVVRISLPVSSFITAPNSQQIPTFTPLMCDPIVHIPVIEVCSSGQGYFVSAGPAISTTIPPFHPNLVSPLIPATESMVEKGARETLRLLISSTQTNPQLMEALPAVLTNTNENYLKLVAGSRGLYSGTRDVDAIANRIAAMEPVSLSGRGDGAEIFHCNDDGAKRFRCDDDLENQPEGSGGSSSTAGTRAVRDRVDG